MNGEPAAHRYPAAAFPEIQEIRLIPPGVGATLINLSATGTLVECAARARPGAMLSVQFQGKFEPASVESRVVRCEVAGIAPDGSLRYHLGIAFSARIALRSPSEPAEAERFEPEPPAAVITAATPVATGAPAFRNRW